MHTHLNTHSENSTAQDSAHITVLEDDLGTSVVREIYSILKIDEEWSHWGSRGFDWWGHQHRQRIWSSQGFDDDGFTIYQLCAETEIVRNLSPNNNTDDMLAALNAHASLGSLIYLPEEQRIVVHSAMYAHEETASWVGQFLANAAIIHPELATELAPYIVAMLGGEPDESAHPDNGFRVEPDEMLNVPGQLYVPHGQGESAWAGSDEFEEIANFLNTGNCFATGDPTGLCAEFAFGDEQTTLLRIDSRERHPVLGSGLLFRLNLPLNQTKHEAGILAAHLNRLEQRGGVMAHMLGSWAVKSWNGADLAYVSFVPTIMHKKNLLMNLVMSMFNRSRDVAGLLAESDEECSVIEVMSQRLGIGENR